MVSRFFVFWQYFFFLPSVFSHDSRHNSQRNIQRHIEQSSDTSNGRPSYSQHCETCLLTRSVDVLRSHSQYVFILEIILAGSQHVRNNVGQRFSLKEFYFLDLTHKVSGLQLKMRQYLIVSLHSKRWSIIKVSILHCLLVNVQKICDKTWNMYYVCAVVFTFRFYYVVMFYMPIIVLNEFHECILFKCGNWTSNRYRPQTVMKELLYFILTTLFHIY